MKKLSKLLLAISLSASCTFSYGQTISENSLTETTNLVTAGNKAVTLLGEQVFLGDTAPDFKVVDSKFAPINLSKYSGKTVLISVVPSLDTGVCSLQTKRFNEEASNYGEDLVMLTISNDLPFAQKRFCDTEKVENLTVLSDAVWRDFGAKYGLLIKDMGLLTRAIFIVNPENKIAYKELVSNISNHPNYDKALDYLKQNIADSEQAPIESEDKEAKGSRDTTQSEESTTKESTTKESTTKESTKLK